MVVSATVGRSDDDSPRPARTIPPPIPASARGHRPTGLERLLVHVSVGEFAATLERELSRCPSASTAFHLAELWLRHLRSPRRALTYFRRSSDLDPRFHAASWSLRRELHDSGGWSELSALLERELATRADPALAFERAVVAIDAGADDVYAVLERALQIAPSHHGILLESERVLARLDSRSEQRKICEQLAETARSPARKLAYWIAAGRFDRAFPLATTVEAKAQLARTWLRASADDVVAQVLPVVIAATGALVAHRPEQVLAHDELVELLCWHARVGPPEDAWNALARAAELAPENPVVLADLAEAGTLLQRNDLPIVVAAWRLAETRPDQLQMVEWWDARAIADSRLRPLVRMLAENDPGFAILASVLEFDALHACDLGALAEVYLALARKALGGSWLPGPPAPNPAAAGALYVQAAELLSRYVATAESVERAYAILQEALVNAPEFPAAVEAMITLADARGQPEVAIGMIRSQLARDPLQHRALLERAARIAHTHGRVTDVIAIERELVERDPRNPILGWRHYSSLARHRIDDARRDAVDRLARDDPDPARRSFALAETILPLEECGDLDGALARARELVSLCPEDELTRERLLGVLRARGDWEAVVTARNAEIATAVRLPLIRRAHREIAWVLETRIRDRTRAADAYGRWAARLPDDTVALEGLLRCSDTDEIGTRQALRALDPFSSTQFLFARAVDGAQAFETYAALLHGREGAVALAAALSLARTAASTRDGARYAAAAQYLASATTDPDLAATLHEESGWCALAAANLDAADAAFAAAGTRTGAWFGRMLVACRRSDGNALEATYVALARLLEQPHLLQRASLVAANSGDGARAIEHLEAARTLEPTSLDIFVALDDVPIATSDPSDPFASAEHLLDRAALCATRAELAQDPMARLDFELDRADALELAGQLREAAAAVVDALTRMPRSWRARIALRRLAQQLDRPGMLVHAVLGLAQLHRSQEHRLQLFREAMQLVTGIHDVELERAIASQIVSLDPHGAEISSYLAMVRQEGDDHRSVAVLSLALRRSPDVEQLNERARLLEKLGEHELASQDFSAVLAYDGGHREALAGLGALASARGAGASCAVVAVSRDRDRLLARIEARVAQALVIRPSVPDPTAPMSRVDASWEAESTRPDSKAIQAALQLRVSVPDVRVSPSVIRRPTGQVHALDAVTDALSGATVLTDLTLLQEQERCLARETSAGEYEVEIAGANPPGAVVVEVTESSAMAITLGALERHASTMAELRVPALGEAFALVAEPLPVRDLGSIGPTIQPTLDLDESAVVIMSYEELQPTKTAIATVELLTELERELGLSTSSDERGELHLEAGRTAVGLGQSAVALAHFEAAVAQGAWAVPALRALRRIAWQESDLAECARLVQAELTRASERERPSLMRYRTDLLLATGEEDLARVSVGDQLELADRDPAVLIASLQLAFLDERIPELIEAFDRLNTVFADPTLAASFAFARTVFDGFALPTLEAERYQAGGIIAAMRSADAKFDLACQIESNDPSLAGTLAALALDRDLTVSHREAAVQLATRAMPRDALVARLCAEALLSADEPKKAAAGFARWSRTKAPARERAYAAARAAELDHAFARLWLQALELDPDDDYAHAMAYAVVDAAGEVRTAIDIDIAIARATGRLFPTIRGARRLADLDPPRAIEVLEQAYHEHPTSLVVADGLARLLEDEDRWEQAAAVLAPIVDQMPVFAARYAHDISRSGGESRAAWARVLAVDPRSPEAIAAIPDAVQPELPWEWSSQQIQQRTSHPPLFDDPRHSVLAIVNAVERCDLLSVVAEHERRAQVVTGSEAAVLRMRAAHLALDLGSPQKAVAILDSTRLQIYDLRAIASQLAGLPPPVRPSLAFSLDRQLREAEAEHDPRVALRRFRDVFARSPQTIAVRMRYERAALGVGALDDLERLANARIADSTADVVRTAEAHADLAGIFERGGKPHEAQLSAALEADPTRLDILHQLTRIAAHRLDHERVYALRQLELSRNDLVREDLAVLTVDAAILARRSRCGRAEALEVARLAFEHVPECDLVLLILHAAGCRAPRSEQSVALDERVATRMIDAESRAAFLTLAAEQSASLGQVTDAFARLQRALQFAPAYEPALHAWERVAVEHQQWHQLFALAKRDQPRERGESIRVLYVAGVAAMLRANDPITAVEMFRFILAVEPTHRDAFVQLRTLFEEAGNESALDDLFRSRLAVEPDPSAQLALHRVLARRAAVANDLERANAHYVRISQLDPDDRGNWTELAQLSVRRGDREAAIRSLDALIGTETNQADLVEMYSLLGTLYATLESGAALAAFQAALAIDPGHLPSLRQLADLAISEGKWSLARTTVDRIIAEPQDSEQLALAWHRSARIAAMGFGEFESAEQLHDRACVEAPTSEASLRALIAFHSERHEPQMLADHLAHLAAVLRARIADQPTDGPAYRTLGLIAAHGSTRLPLATRVALEISHSLGSATTADYELLATKPISEHITDDALFSHSDQHDLRRLFQFFAPQVAKAVGIELAVYGVSRRDRLRPTQPLALLAHEMADAHGLPDVDVYISPRLPYLMVAEPTSPPSLVLGTAIAAASVTTQRFAMGVALRLMAVHLSVPARLSHPRLAALASALTKLVVPNVALELDSETEMWLVKLEKLLGSVERAHPLVMSTDAPRPMQFAEDLQIAGLRAGVVASGSLIAGLVPIATSLDLAIPQLLTSQTLRRTIGVLLG